jgi:hypothetical protein
MSAVGSPKFVPSRLVHAQDSASGEVIPAAIRTVFA